MDSPSPSYLHLLREITKKSRYSCELGIHLCPEASPPLLRSGNAFMIERRDRKDAIVDHQRLF